MQKIKRVAEMLLVLMIVIAFSFLPAVLFKVSDASLLSKEIVRPTVEGQLSAEGKKSSLVNEMYLRKHIWGERFLQWKPVYAFTDQSKADAAAQKAVLNAVNALEEANLLCADAAQMYRTVLESTAATQGSYQQDEMGFLQSAWYGEEYTFAIETEPKSDKVIRFAVTGNHNTEERKPSDALLRQYIAYLQLETFSDFAVKTNINTENSVYRDIASAYSKSCQLYLQVQQSSDSLTLDVVAMSMEEYDALSK